MAAHKHMLGFRINLLVRKTENPLATSSHYHLSISTIILSLQSRHFGQHSNKESFLEKRIKFLKYEKDLDAILTKIFLPSHKQEDTPRDRFHQLSKRTLHWLAKGSSQYLPYNRTDSRCS
jgi:hypothetical protein